MSKEKNISFISYCFDQLQGVVLLVSRQAASVNSLMVKEHFWTKSSFCHSLFVAYLKESGARELKDWQGLKTALKRYFQGEAVEFSAWPVDLSGKSTFTQEVLAVVRGIKWGETMTYKKVATQIGKPKATQAVGQVMRKNKLPLFVPCHRVIGVKNKFGWTGPVDLKQKLLKLELSDV